MELEYGHVLYMNTQALTEPCKKGKSKPSPPWLPLTSSYRLSIHTINTFMSTIISSSLYTSIMLIFISLLFLVHRILVIQQIKHILMHWLITHQEISLLLLIYQLLREPCLKHRHIHYQSFKLQFFIVVSFEVVMAMSMDLECDGL